VAAAGEGIFRRHAPALFTLRDAVSLLDQAGLDVVEVRRLMRLRGPPHAVGRGGG